MARVRKQPGTREAFLEYEQALGDTIAFYDVKSGSTLADYYASTFVQFIKNKLK